MRSDSSLNAPALRRLLAAHGLRLTKRLGQHYLVDPHIVEQILACAAPGPTETVVEVGAGLGALSQSLAARAGRLIALEVDPRIAAVLRQRIGVHDNVEVRVADVLRVDWAAVAPAVVVGAIPYHITSPILVTLTEHRRHLTRAVLVLQREVGDRLAAGPGTKAYGRLTLFIQYGWRVEVVFGVPRRAFFPQPEVDSVCVQLLPRATPAVAVPDERRFFRLIQTAFAQRRKTLANCLLADDDGAWGGRAAVVQALAGLGLAETVRGETLSLPQFAALEAALRGARLR